EICQPNTERGCDTAEQNYRGIALASFESREVALRNLRRLGKRSTRHPALLPHLPHVSAEARKELGVVTRNRDWTILRDPRRGGRLRLSTSGTGWHVAL